ncbi:MAG: family 20 glycosylhydrolase, partial [Candidatus Izemoplasmatales bacterium]
EKSNELVFTKVEDLAQEEYCLDISETKIEVFYNDYRSAVFALMSLYQLLDDKIPCQIVSDKPDLALRGFMLDISRDKTPKMETIKTFIDYMMMLKMNHLELYVEGFSLQLPSFPNLPYETPLTPEEYQELERYSAVRGVDLVPNINTFGHMTKWLELDEYHDLAECENGYERIGHHYPASTLNPLDERSIKLAQKIVEDVLSFSKSTIFNINGDEPFELGLGKSKAACEKLGIGQVYIDFIAKVAETVLKNNREVLVWGDVLAKHPEMVPDFPKNLTVVEWGYNYNHDFDLRTKRLSENNLNFILAPGTSSWNSFAYRHLDMLGSVDRANEALKKYGGKGMLIADWGDNGHPQPHIFSFTGLAYSASETWTMQKNYQPVEEWLKKYVFTEYSNQAEIVRALGEYSAMEDNYVSNGTGIFRSWMMAGFYPNDSLKEQFDFWKKSLNNVALNQETAQEIIERIEFIIEKVQGDSLIDKELILSGRMIKLSAMLNDMINNDTNALTEAKNLLKEVKKDYEIIWLKRSRVGGLKSSMRRIEKIEEFLNNWNELNSK